MVYVVIRFSIPQPTLIRYYFCLHVFFIISWQITKSLPHKKKEEGREDGEIVEEKKDKSSADGKVPKLEVEVKVDGKEEGEEELHSHTTVSWDRPRRSVNQWYKQ